MSAADYTTSYDPDTDFDRHYTLATARRIAERVRPGDRILELGCATGLMGAQLAGPQVPLLGIDRSPAYLERARARRTPGTRYETGDLDSIQVEGEFDHILATNVLHELRDPVEFLRRCRAMLRPGGVIHLTLQNPRSIHRLAALELGMIDSLTEISDRGERWGTRGLWTADQLETLAAEAGLAAITREGIMIKPLPNSLMAELPEQAVEGLIRAARYLPEHCAMTYLVLVDA